VTAREALRICGRREHLRRTIRIALVVGTILTLINQLDVILAGDASTITWVKAALNYCVPFVVSNLGLLAGKRAEQEKPAPGWGLTRPTRRNSVSWHKRRRRGTDGLENLWHLRRELFLSPALSLPGGWASDQ
jgi:hypothetical protein